MLSMALVDDRQRLSRCTDLTRTGQPGRSLSPELSNLHKTVAQAFDSSLSRRLRWPSIWTRTSASTPAPTSGSLEGILNMPIDILYEIFRHLHPIDLLSLSRTTRCLRGVLLDKHARGVWRGSLSSVRVLPTCPSDLSEPRYSSLAFDDVCDFCPASGVKEAFWLCRIKCCKRCFDHQFISEKDLELRIPEGVVIKKLDSIFPSVLKRDYTTPSIGRMFFYRPVVNRYLEELALLDPAQGLTQPVGSEEAVQTWINTKKQLLATKLAHTSLLEYWTRYWSAERPSCPQYSFAAEIIITTALSMLLLLLWKDWLVSRLCG